MSREDIQKIRKLTGLAAFTFENFNQLCNATWHSTID